MTEITYTINQNCVATVSTLIVYGRLHLKVTFNHGRFFTPMESGLEIHAGNAGAIMEAVKAVNAVLLENGVIAKRRG